MRKYQKLYETEKGEVAAMQQELENNRIQNTELTSKINRLEMLCQRQEAMIQML